jgi:hypothetical protein
MKLIGIAPLVLLAGIFLLPALFANASESTLREATFVVG